MTLLKQSGNGEIRSSGHSTAGLLAAALALAGCGGESKTEAHVIYRNGSVVTVDGANTVAQALAVRDGKILAVGSSADIGVYVGSDTKVVDLAGKAVIPGIYDAHSHFTYTGINAKFEANLNSPPISTVNSIGDLIALLKLQQAKLASDAWVTGFGYDDTLIAEKRHPTRYDLDQVSSTQPVLITHVSGHLAVANSAALALAGITSSTPNPSGGVIRKDARGVPDGVLEETAAQLVSKFKPALTAAQIQEGIKAAVALYASHGVTTANDGATTAGIVAAMEQAAQVNDLPLRVVAWPMLETMESVDKVVLKSGKVKIGGVKDFADGSIQGYTGYLGHPYHTPFHGDEKYQGFPRYDREILAKRVLDVHKSGRQSLIHGNGDAAIADILYAFRKAQEAHPRADTRPVVIHSQMARDDELDEMKSLRVIPSFFVLHTYYWGDRHRDIFIGPDRASRISPTKSARDREITYTIHTDTPIVPMEPMRLIWAAVNRLSTSGAIIGAEQRVSAIDALRATTINAAYQNFEEKERGSIEVGKWADLAILSANPLEVAPATIKDIKVLETIVEGKSIYKAGN